MRHHSQDASGKIEYDELTKVMEKLGSSCGAAEIKDVFVVRAMRPASRTAADMLSAEFRLSQD